MATNNNDFSERIAYLQKEISAIKGASTTPNVSFFSENYFVPNSSANNWKIKATSSLGAFPFLVQMIFPEEIQTALREDRPIDFDELHKTITWHFYPFDSPTGSGSYFKLISSVPVAIEVDYE